MPVATWGPGGAIGAVDWAAPGRFIHAISFTPAHYTMAASATPPSWEVIAIGHQGEVREPVQGLLAGPMGDPKQGGLGCADIGPNAVMTGVETMSATFDKLGWKWSCNLSSNGPASSLEMNWAWDSGKNNTTANRASFRRWRRKSTRRT